VDGSAVHALIAIVSATVPDDLDANDRRVDGEPVHPTSLLVSTGNGERRFDIHATVPET